MGRATEVRALLGARLGGRVEAYSSFHSLLNCGSQTALAVQRLRLCASDAGGMGLTPGQARLHGGSHRDASAACH